MLDLDSGQSIATAYALGQVLDFVGPPSARPTLRPAALDHIYETNHWIGVIAEILSPVHRTRGKSRGCSKSVSGLV
jgi:hypothetical protein